MTKLHRLPAFAAVLFLFGGIAASCDSADSPKADSLASGECPLVINAEGLHLSAQDEAPMTPSRATVDNDWEGVTSVAVQVDGVVKQYSATPSADNSTATLTSTTPFYWESSSERKSVAAWHPYSASYPERWVRPDQRNVDDYRACDLIKGELSGLSYAERNKPMVFSHQSAKIQVTLEPGEGITLGGNVAVEFMNIANLTGEGRVVTPYRPDASAPVFCALLPPQTIAAGSKMIKVTVEGNEFFYSPNSPAVLAAGSAYSYTVTVKATDIEVKEATSQVWNKDSEVIVDEVTLRYKPSDLKMGDYYYSDGTVSDGGLRERVLTIRSNGIAEEKSSRWETSRPARRSDKKCIGIVFHVGRHRNDASDYSSSPVTTVHGYVVALEDANDSNLSMWGASTPEIGCLVKDENGNVKRNFENNQDGSGSDNFANIDWNGYDWTKKITVQANSAGGLNGTTPSGYQATYHAVNYMSDQSADIPTTSTGWFLPAIGQIYSVYVNRHKLFGVEGSDVNTATIDWGTSNNFARDWYWSSSESHSVPKTQAVVLKIERRKIYVNHADKYHTSSGNQARVRPILVF